MTYVIDRIEDGIATLIPDDTSEILNIPCKDGFYPGAVVKLCDEEFIIVDSESHNKLKKENEQRLQNLFNMKGDNDEN